VPATRHEEFSAAVAELAAALRAAAATDRHRRLIVLAGSHAWCTVSTAHALDSLEPPGTATWLTGNPPPGVHALTAARTPSILGTEAATLVFDAHDGFDPDAFGLAAGTVPGGGLLWLLTPPLEDWPDVPDPEHRRIAVAPYRAQDVTGRFLRRIAAVVRRSPCVTVIEEDRPLPLPSSCGPAPPPGAASADADCRTDDQARAVEAVIKVAFDRRRRPAVLTSDRGRGKSAAFGIAAARVLEQGRQRVVVTVPHLDAVQAVFAHAHRILPGSTVTRAALHSGEARIDFVAADELARTPHEADLVLVDEAAALPAPLLETLLRRHSRIAFATTVHGYEGTGRGFALRFQRTLDRRTPLWRSVRMETPIRWAPGDPVERFVFRALLLDAAPAPDEAVRDAAPGSCVVERIDRDALAADEATLCELFGLLVLAHYRTRPYDLRHLLDGPNLELHALRHGRHVVGVAVIAHEGRFDAVTARGIWAGRSRPHGHLVPESLAAHVGIERAPTLKCARIMRIAVHPAIQGRGLGSRLLDGVLRSLESDGIDYAGSSFGATTELLRFWRRSGFDPVRVSIKRGAASGAHSVIVVRPASGAGRELLLEARARLRAQLPHQLSDPLRALEPELAAALLRGDTGAPPAGGARGLDAADWKDVASFAHARRLYAVCVGALWKLACRALQDPDDSSGLEPPQRDLLIMKVMQKRSWAACADALGLSGRDATTTVLRGAARVLVERYGNEVARREAERLERGE
jgi:tRNA(Met) cytidine acetyltransferase